MTLVTLESLDKVINCEKYNKSYAEYSPRPSVLFLSIKLRQNVYGRNAVGYQIKAVGECLFFDIIYCKYMIITSMLLVKFCFRLS